MTTAMESTNTGVRLAVLHDLAEGGKLRTNRIFEVTETGISFAGAPTQEQWLDLLRT